MARFLVWSDLHDEFWEGFDLPDLSAPVDDVLIAGDTYTTGGIWIFPPVITHAQRCVRLIIGDLHCSFGVSRRAEDKFCGEDQFDILAIAPQRLMDSDA